jgi:predicted MFS family arabinose efflux permease
VLFIRDQQRSAQPLMPLRLFRSRERAGAYAARFLFNGALLSFFFFMTQYLQGVSAYSPLETGLAFLPVTFAAFAAAAVIPRLPQRLSNGMLAVAGCAAMLIGTAWLNRVSATTAYLTGIAAPMIVFGIGQGFGFSSLTNAGMAGVASKDAGVAGRLVNVAHHIGGAFGLGVLVTVFAAAGSGAKDARDLLAQRVSASLTAAAAFLVLALVIVITAQRTTRRATCRSRGTPSTRVPARPTGSPAPSTSTP